MQLREETLLRPESRTDRPLAAVAFDMDDTLCDFAGSEAAARKAMAWRLATEFGLDPDLLHETYEAIDQRRLAHGASGWWTRTGALAHRTENWRLTLQRFGVEDPELPLILAREHEAIRRRHLYLFPEALPVLRALHGQLPLVLITNGPADNQRSQAELLGLTAFFDHILVEGELGYGKPDPRVFRLAEERVGAPPEAWLMVGDNLRADVAGALAAGWRSVWVNRRGAARPADLAPHFVVESLHEVPAIVHHLRGAARSA